MLIHSFNQYLSTYSVPDTVPGTGEAGVNIIDTNSAFLGPEGTQTLSQIIT